MAIVRNITRTVPVPHEAPAAFVLRILTWKQLEAARKTQMDKSREEAKAFGAEFIKALQSGDTQKAKETVKAFQYDVLQFDRAELLKAGIASWSGDTYDGLLPSEGIDDLDETTAAWAAETIVGMSRPRTEAELKNSAAASI